VQSRAPDSNNLLRDVLICLLLALITLALYRPVRSFQFNNYDDAEYISLNPAVQDGLHSDTIAWAFTTGYASNWHPLTWLSHMLDCQLYGLNPTGPHVTNLLFHLVNTLLLFGLLRQMTGAVWRAAFVAALFAWHPLHVESVAWVAERKDVLSAFFGLLTLIAYVKYVKQFKIQRLRQAQSSHSKFKLYYSLAVVFFVLGLMSKPMLVSLPLVMLLLDYWPLGRIFDLRFTIYDLKASEARESFFRLLLEKLPFVLLSLVSCYITLHVQKSGGAMDTAPVPLAGRVANALNSYVSYLAKLFWPHDLAVLYPHPKYLPMGQVIAAGIFLLVISAIALSFIRRRPWLAVGWFWFLIMLIPVIGLVQVGAQAMADRYTYLPAIGIFIAIAWELPELLALKPAAKPALATAAILALTACLVITHRQLPVWKDSVSLFSHTVEVTTGNPIAHGSLGQAYAELGQTNQALTEYNSALALDPHDLMALGNKASIYSLQGRLDDAIALYQRAIEFHPNSYLSHRNLGSVYFKQGRLDDAAAQYRAAIEINPQFTPAVLDLGIVLARQGKVEAAVVQLRRALQLAEDSGQDELATQIQARLQLYESGRPVQQTNGPAGK
jgi:protein O-mannosyl-transferase